MLKESVYEKIKEMADNIEKIVYENHETNERLGIETYVIIVKTSSYKFRIYQGMLHSTGRITVKFVSIDSDMLKAMQSLNIKE